MNISTVNCWFSWRFQDLEFRNQAPQMGSPNKSGRQLPYPRIHCSVRLVPTLRYAMHAWSGLSNDRFWWHLWRYELFLGSLGKSFLVQRRWYWTKFYVVCYPPRTSVTFSHSDLLCFMYYMVVAFDPESEQALWNWNLQFEYSIQKYS